MQDIHQQNDGIEFISNSEVSRRYEETLRAARPEANTQRHLPASTVTSRIEVAPDVFPPGLDEIDLGKTDGRNFLPDINVEARLHLQLAQAFPRPPTFVKPIWSLDGDGKMSEKSRAKVASATEEVLKYGASVNYDRYYTLDS